MNMHMHPPSSHEYTYVPSIIDVWTKYGERTKYGEPRLYDDGETDLITKT
jgi:hypothetical protein